MIDINDRLNAVSHALYLDALNAARFGNNEKLAALLASNQQPIPREVMDYLAAVQMGFESVPKQRGNKAKRRDFALNPDLLHHLIDSCIYSRREKGNLKPVELGIEDAAWLTGLGRDVLIKARKGLGPYRTRNLWKTRRV